MIKIYDKNNNYIRGTEDYKDPVIEEELNISDTLSLTFPLEYKDVLEEEGYIEGKDIGKFVIKEINLNVQSISIVCKQDLEAFKSWTGNKSYITKTMQYILDDLLAGTGWTGVADTGIKRTVTGRNLSKLDYIMKAIDIFKYEVKFDGNTKTVYAKNKLGAYKGSYFHDEINLKSLTSSSDTYDFATRIIPLGFDGMGIEEVNGGKNYVEDKTYSNKTITIEWLDERYEVKENLKRDAIKKLETLSKPYRNYSCDVEDLSRKSEYEFLAYEVGDTIDLTDREKGIKEKQRIVKKTIYLHDSSKDSVEIANRPREFSYDDEMEEIKGQFASTEASLELLEDRIVGRVERVERDVDENKTNIGELELTADEFSVTMLETIERVNATETNIGELELTSSEFRTRISNTEKDISSNSNAISSNSSSISQNASNINFKVSKNDIISSINLDYESASIKASKINLVGAVTVLSNITGNLGTITAGTINGINLIGNSISGGTININSGAFRVGSDGDVWAANGNFKIDPAGDGVYNSYAKTSSSNDTSPAAARWKRSDGNYFYQDLNEARIYIDGRSRFSLRERDGISSNWALTLGGSDGATIKAINPGIQARTWSDGDYAPFMGSDFRTPSGSIISTASTFGIKASKASPKLDIVKQTPIYEMPLSEVDNKYRMTNFSTNKTEITFMENEVPAEVELGGSISLKNTIGVLWKALQELSAEVDELKGVK